MRQWLESLEQFAIDVILERRYGKRAALLRMLLFLLSLVFRQIVQGRLWFVPEAVPAQSSAGMHGHLRGEPDRRGDREDARGGKSGANAARGRTEGGDPEPGVQEPEAAVVEADSRAADGTDRRVDPARGEQRLARLARVARGGRRTLHARAEPAGGVRRGGQGPREGRAVRGGALRGRYADFGRRVAVPALAAPGWTSC